MKIFRKIYYTKLNLGKIKRDKTQLQISSNKHILKAENDISKQKSTLNIN